MASNSISANMVKEFTNQNYENGLNRDNIKINSNSKSNDRAEEYMQKSELQNQQDESIKEKSNSKKGEIFEFTARPSIELSRKSRNWLFAFILLINFCINLENGTIPASIVTMMEDLKCDEEAIGLFGSLLYVGNLISSIILMYIINKFQRKYLFILTLFFTGLCLIFFTFSKNLPLLFFIRIMTGVFEVYANIYCPVWVDQFGQSNRKTVYMSFLQVTGPLGIVSGYATTALFINSKMNWKFAFYIQGGILCFLAIILFFIPNIYFSSHYFSSNSAEEKEKTKKNIEVNNSIINPCQQMRDDNKTIFIVKDIDDSESSGFWKNLCRLIKVKIYILCVAANSLLLFISTIIQYWTSHYLEKVLLVDKSTILWAFVVTCITAPTLGIVIGACIVEKFGGYESKNSLTICCIYAVICFACSIPLTQFNTLTGFAIFLWLFLFFGGCIVPNIIGVTISSLPNDLKASGGSSTNFFNNVIGFIPAPFFYGLIYDKTKHNTPRLAMGISLIFSVSVLILIFIANIFWRRKFNLDDKIEQEVVIQNAENKEIPQSRRNSNKLDKQDVSNLKIEYIEIDLQNEDSKIKTNVNTNIFPPTIASFEPIDKKDIIKSCFSMKGQSKDSKGSSVKDLPKFNSAGLFTGNNYNNNIINNPKITKDNILFKGENGNQEVYEIKFDKENLKIFNSQ